MSGSASFPLLHDAVNRLIFHALLAFAITAFLAHFLRRPAPGDPLPKFKEFILAAYENRQWFSEDAGGGGGGGSGSGGGGGVSEALNSSTASGTAQKPQNRPPRWRINL